MMHKWSSFEGLVDKFKEQECKDRFVYQEFESEMKEWDNVPPVCPRFLFYLQSCLKETISYTKEVNDRPTTLDIKALVE